MRNSEKQIMYADLYNYGESSKIIYRGTCCDELREELGLEADEDGYKPTIDDKFISEEELKFVKNEVTNKIEQIVLKNEQLDIDHPVDNIPNEDIVDLYNNTK